MATIIKDHVTSGDSLEKHRKITILFHDAMYANKAWNVSIFTGFAPTVPIVRYHTFREKYKVKVPTQEDIKSFLEKLYSKVHPPLECAVIALIYVEKLMVPFLSAFAEPED